MKFFLFSFLKSTRFPKVLESKINMDLSFYLVDTNVHFRNIIYA